MSLTRRRNSNTPVNSSILDFFFSPGHRNGYVGILPQVQRFVVSKACVLELAEASGLGEVGIY